MRSPNGKLQAAMRFHLGVNSSAGLLERKGPAREPLRATAVARRPGRCRLAPTDHARPHASARAVCRQRAALVRCYGLESCGPGGRLVCARAGVGSCLLPRHPVSYMKILLPVCFLSGLLQRPATQVYQRTPVALLIFPGQNRRAASAGDGQPCRWEGSGEE